MLQKIMFMIFLIQTICKRVSFFLSMHLHSTSILNITQKKWLYLPNALFLFDGTFKIEKSNLLT